MTRARWLLIPVVMMFCGWAQQPARPACTARNRGEVWPAPNSPHACRPLQMCTMKFRKYRWKAITVDVSQLSKRHERRSACEATQISQATAQVR